MTYKLATIPGDGIGPEVTREAMKCLDAALARVDLSVDRHEYGLGKDHYLRTGEAISDSILDELRGFDSIFLGAVGHPDVKPGILEKGLLLRLRFEFDQYINLRPVKLYPGVATPLARKGPEDIDFVVVRENTECLYTGVGGILKQGTADEVAQQTAVYTRKGTERCVRWAFDLAQSRQGKRLALVDKANVLTYGHDLWRRVFEEVGAEYPDVERDAYYVDACCMVMVEAPEKLDTVVTCNMFGDIITDLGASVQGGIGIAASGNINPEGVSMFEPVHGSAPPFAGKNVVNPLAAILAAAMMVRYMTSSDESPADAQARSRAADLMEESVETVLGQGRIPDLSVNSGLGTDEIGDMIAEEIAGR
jgi:3-isopropylmalate dehydrogenase